MSGILLQWFSWQAAFAVNVVLAVDFGTRERGIDRLLVSVHGWSHSQSDPDLKAATRTGYRRLRNAYAKVVRRWQAAGTFDPTADARGVAELLTSITLGFVAQRALAGDADVRSHIGALESLCTAIGSRPPGS